MRKHVRRAVITLGAMRVERVHFGACRMVARDVQRIEVVPIGPRSAAPRPTEKPQYPAKIAVSSSVTWLTGWIEP